MKTLIAIMSLVLAGAIWLPTLHLFYTPAEGQFAGSEGISAEAEGLLSRLDQRWRAELSAEDAETVELRRSNAEWDFMGRSYLVWALANTALGDEKRVQSAIEMMDLIIDDTLAREDHQGMYHFLMPYATRKAWAVNPPRSQFIDGEIALMLACRRMVADNERYKALLTGRIEIIIDRMGRSPVLSAESYPDECWTFCNVIALAAIRLADHLDGTDHSQFLSRWVAVAKDKLIDPATGMLVSSYTVAGRHMDGPEGSSIWMVCHCLQLIDSQFAADQYRRARKELGRRFLGFGYSREWPVSSVGRMDIDSGATLPVLGLSVGASGQAFVGAAAFGDDSYLSSLAGSLAMAGFPLRDETGLRHCAGNYVGDAVLLYSMTLGPVWDAVLKGTGK